MTNTVDRTPARLVAAGAALVATSVLADSAMEHYRGSFRNPAMWLPLVSSSLSIAFGGHRLAHADASGLPVARNASEATAVGVGALGLGFHAYNITKRPGGIAFQNLFHAAPFGAPAALILVGALNRGADVIARDGGSRGQGRAIATIAAVGIAGTVAEATLLHFRGAFQNPAMWLPVVVPPIAAASVVHDAIDGRPRAVSIALLGMTAAIGISGVAFHTYGISRRMGGWRNWRQNLLAGPPLPAPPAFTGLAVAALGALLLMRRTHG